MLVAVSCLRKIGAAGYICTTIHKRRIVKMQSIDMMAYKRFVYETIPLMIKNKKSRYQIEKVQSKLFFTNHFFTKHFYNLKYKASDPDPSLFFSLDVAWEFFFILINSKIPLDK